MQAIKFNTDSEHILTPVKAYRFTGKKDSSGTLTAMPGFAPDLSKGPVTVLLPARAVNFAPMKTDLPFAASTVKTCPTAWRAEVESQLAGNEEILAWLEVDLDARLHFTPGLVLVTNRRLLARAPAETGWQDWPYRDELALQHHDHAGVGSLELHDDQGRLACWRYTLGHNIAALRLIEHSSSSSTATFPGSPPASGTKRICPNCKAPLRRTRTNARSARAKSIPRPRPGRCSGCGALPSPTAGSCWPAFC